eukprot:gene32316-39902_t
MGGDYPCERRARLTATYKAYFRTFGPLPEVFWPPLKPVQRTVRYQGAQLGVFWIDEAWNEMEQLESHIAEHFNSQGQSDVDVNSMHLFVRQGTKSPLTLMISDPARPRVFIESFQHEVFALDVDMQHTTVGDVKRGILRQIGCPLENQHLYLSENHLDDNDADLISIPVDEQRLIHG